MPGASRNHVVFTQTEVITTDWETQTRKRIVYGAYLDLDHLGALAIKASSNMHMKARQGPVHVEIQSVEDV